MKQFSKQIIRAMVKLWFAGALFGAAVVVAEMFATFFSFDSYSAMITVHLPELLAYIGAPMGCGIVAYMVKTAFENKEKIRQDYNPDYDQENFGGF